VLAGQQGACPAGALATPDRLADLPASPVPCLPDLLQEAGPRLPRAANQPALASEAAAAEAKRRAEHDKKQARYAALFEGRSSGGSDQTGVPEDLAFAQLKAKVRLGGDGRSTSSQPGRQPGRQARRLPGGSAVLPGQTAAGAGATAVCVAAAAAHRLAS
jgi:hypothetical protein